MPRRLTFAADTPAETLYAWIANAAAEAFTLPRVLPILRRPPAEPEPGLPVLFEDLPIQRRGEPPVAVPAPPDPEPEAPAAAVPLEVLMRRIVGNAIGPLSPLTAKRRANKATREAKAAANRDAEIAAVEPAPEEAPTEPALTLTMDMGPFHKAHMRDRPDPMDRFDVACPPFHLHDEDHTDPVDQFLGQVVGIEPDRALLFRRQDPDIMDGCEVGQRYVLLRFRDDKEGQVWSMPVEGEDDAAVLTAIRTTTALYRLTSRGSPQI